MREIAIGGLFPVPHLSTSFGYVSFRSSANKKAVVNVNLSGIKLMKTRKKDLKLNPVELQ